MNSLSSVLTAALLIGSLGATGYGLTQETKDKINNAAKPIQRGVGKAADAFGRMMYGARRDFESEVQAALDQSQDLKSKLAAGSPPGTKLDVEKARKDLDERSADLQEKAAALKAAAEKDYSARYEETQSALDKLQEANFKTAAWYQDARAKEEQRAAEAVEDLNQDIANLQAKTPATKDGRQAVRSAVQELQGDHQKAMEKVQQLKGAEPDKWANIRTDIDRIVDGAKRDYQETISTLGLS